MKTRLSNRVLKLTYTGLCIALCILLPFLTGQIPQIGSALSPMHIPALLCGLLCGWQYGIAVGIAPILRYFLFSMPPLNAALPMCFELAAYAVVIALLYWVLPKKVPYLYLSLVGAMLAGRVVGGVAKALLLTAGFIKGSPVTFAGFFTAYFVQTLPGVVAHLILVPVIFLALKRASLIPEPQGKK